MQDLDFNLLPALDALLAKRNVTFAARSMGISQPTMSGILARLRTQLRDPLLVRVGRQMELTPYAETLKQEVRQILLSLNRLTLTAAEPDGKLRRHFTIMTSEFGQHLLLPDFFRTVMASNPQVRLSSVRIDRPIDAIFNGDVDLCLTGDRIDVAAAEPARTVRTRALLHDRFVCVMDRNHPLQGPVTMAQLMGFPRVGVHFGGSDHAAEDVAMAHLSEQHPPTCRVFNFLAIAPMVAGTRAVGLMPARLLPFLANRQAIRTAELTGDFDTISIKMLWHTRYDNDPAHAWLRGQMVDLGHRLERGPEANGRGRRTAS